MTKGELIRRKKLWLILVLAVFVALMTAPTNGLAQRHDDDRGRGPSCHQKCDRNYHCENRLCLLQTVLMDITFSAQ